MMYAEMLAAHWWNITPSDWDSRDLEDRARMLKTWQTENQRNAIEQAEANKPKKPHGKLP